MKSVRVGLIVVAVCALMVLAAGIRVAIWVHQAEALALREAVISAQMLVLRQNSELLLAMESGQRGYLLTGDASYLDTYDQAKREFGGGLQRFEALFRDGPAPVAEIQELAKLADAKMDGLARAIQLRRDGDAAAALAAFGGDEAPRLLRQYRARTAALIDELLKARVESAAECSRTFRSIYILLALLVLIVDLLIVVSIVTLSVSIQRLRELQQEQERVAMHDALTNLPNRRYLGEWLTMSLAMARRSKQQVVLLYFDLDGFKEVNDQFGHEAGDRVLKITASRLRRALRISDFVARLGGDEFVAVLPEAPTAPALVALIERLSAGLSEAPIPELKDGAVSASIGAATFPVDGDTVEALLAAADRAMYEVKQHRKSRARQMALPQDARQPAETAAH